MTLFFQQLILKDSGAQSRKVSYSENLRGWPVKVDHALAQMDKEGEKTELVHKM